MTHTNQEFAIQTAKDYYMSVYNVKNILIKSDYDMSIFYTKLEMFIRDRKNIQ